MRNILDVAPSLAEYFIDAESVIANKLFPVDATENILGKYRQYFGLLHDSWILKAQSSGNRFLLQLNDFTTHVFADALINKKGLEIDDEKLVFKIDIEFEINNLSYNTVDDDGVINQILPTNIDEYLYEEMLSDDGHVADIGLVVWTSGSEIEQGRYILILINTTKVNLSEHQDEDWKRIFGNKYDSYYSYFKLKLQNGTYLSDQSLCENLIDEIDENVG